ncbi:GNAT family N-acetyltransferase [Pseudooceanicola sediminis]|uniref:GNAT family N-acetyltransferase n=1 Tax=Pseudooceanicola sediminis TaxID=2211117 RepID=A0A399J5A4_9RHOB|nr:GNAT family N-acetyltransferase [Pseudooceanicola sediminis]KAA2316898.1 GNAT family N-acetyltransferase [Puniceibacterium sp. HSS470]RII40648.1 GNAT family N-acetyltransferase [Pseudooceanicola sediminis]|tara:strand:+ start:100516 stop:100968 length:453 start_codon:yes stop_codon:yes gene_type:complete
MTTSLHLANAADLERLLPMVRACHEELGYAMLTPEALSESVLPLLEGDPHGAIYIIGPNRAPIGYAALSFGWSLEFGGLDGSLQQIWIRPGVRGRGIGTEVLSSLPRALAQAGLAALHLEVKREDEKTRRLYHLSGFRARDNYMLMSRRF